MKDSAPCSFLFANATEMRVSNRLGTERDPDTEVSVPDSTMFCKLSSLKHPKLRLPILMILLNTQFIALSLCVN